MADTNPPGMPVPSDDDLGPEMVVELAKYPPLNIQRFLALEPECFAGWNQWLHGMYELKLDPRLREIMILRIGARAHSEYELFQHRAVARTVGVTDAEIATILADEPVTTLSEEANLLCRVVDEMNSGGPMSDETFGEFAKRYPGRQAVQWLLVIAHWAAVVRLLNGLRVPLEGHTPLEGEASPLG